MSKSIYTPFTYLIRVVLAGYLVLSEFVINKVVIRMTYGASILHLQFMLLFRDGSMVSRMSSKCDKLLKLKKKHYLGNQKLFNE